jgi:hypothetical protein
MKLMFSYQNILFLQMRLFWEMHGDILLFWDILVELEAPILRAELWRQ